MLFLKENQVNVNSYIVIAFEKADGLLQIIKTKSYLIRASNAK